MSVKNKNPVNTWFTGCKSGDAGSKTALFGGFRNPCKTAVSLVFSMDGLLLLVFRAFKQIELNSLELNIC
ncbi:hypothetical protein F6A46_06840 [Tenacibaculum finnmarkense genomovar ulcerans]|uniref:hypothetical protein n=1 Tax=Tenacibaculum finnmarkense TaxID=2781243 RepID=UPI00187BB265|nr:hypothetical protein [Tenacibaculum finnmarkense]MBE7687946.1 hypothetical protein [Tenacibaculum finnmarkense genomovar ulcerans]